MSARKGSEDIEMELNQAISEEFKNEALILCRALKQVNHCRQFQPGLKWMISFLVGSVRVPSQSMSSAEVQLYGSGKHRTEIWWKALCKSLRDLGSFVYLNTKVWSVSDNALFNGQIVLSKKAEQWLDEMSATQNFAAIGPAYKQINHAEDDDDDVMVIESGRVFPGSSSEMTSRASYIGFSPMAFTSVPQVGIDNNIDVYGNILRKDFDRLSPTDKGQLIRMLSPFGDYEIYLLHAFYHMSIEMLVQRKNCVSSEEVADMLANCARLGFPLHLQPLGIDYSLSAAVKLVVKSSHLDVTDIDKTMSHLPASKMDQSQLKIVLAIVEYECTLEETPSGRISHHFSREEFTRNLRLSSEPTAKKSKTSHPSMPSIIPHLMWSRPSIRDRRCNKQ